MEALLESIIISHEPAPLPEYMTEFLRALTVQRLIYMNPPTRRALLEELTAMSGGYSRRSSETESEYKARRLGAEIIASRRFRQSQIDNGNIEELLEFNTLSKISSPHIRRALAVRDH